jgi:hypothetical protein
MFCAYIVLRSRNVGSEGVITLPASNRTAYVFGACGFLTTLLAMVLSLVPPAATTNVILYELKVIGGFLLFILVGAGIYWAETKKATA